MPFFFSFFTGHLCGFPAFYRPDIRQIGPEQQQMDGARRYTPAGGSQTVCPRVSTVKTADENLFSPGPPGRDVTRVV